MQHLQMLIPLVSNQFVEIGYSSSSEKNNIKSPFYLTQSKHHLQLEGVYRSVAKGWGLRSMRSPDHRRNPLTDPLEEYRFEGEPMSEF